MKIGLVCPYNVFAGGGVQECVFAIREELIRRGHEAWIITPMPRSANGSVPEGVLFVGGATNVKSFHTTAQISASADNEAIDNLLTEHTFDLLHFHEPWVPFVSRQILARSNVKNVATFHAKLPESRMNRTIEKVITPYTKSIMKSLDALTAVSEAAADYVHSLTDRDIHIIPNGINVEKYQQNVSRKKSSKKTILFVGRLERRKGIMFLLKAFRELVLSDDTIELHIAGAGPDEARLRRYIQDLEIPRTTFHGFVTEKKKIQLMSEATIFCSPAPYGESFGIVLLEAMALGTPIVAGDNPGYSAVMKDRGSLSIINPKDTNSFVRRLQLMIYDEVLRKAWREWALDYVQQYSYEKVVDQYEKLYQSTCKTNESATIE